MGVASRARTTVWIVALAAAIVAAGAATAGGGAPGKPPAKPPAPAPAPAPAANGTVSGMVTDDEDKPFAGAEVKVFRPDRKEPYAATSDAKGFYAVRGLPEGKASVRIRAKGRVAVEKNVVVSATGLTVADAKLLPGVRYSGKVVDMRSAGVGGVKVSATRTREGGDRFFFFFASPASEDATTAADGAFVVDGLAPTQKYTLKFTHAHYLPLELPGLNATAGAGVSDIEAILEDAAWVSGTVLDSAGKPVVGARITKAGDDSDGTTIDFGGMTVFVRFPGTEDKSPATDAKGRFEVGSLKPLEDGDELLLRVRADGFFPGEVKFTTLAGGQEKAGVVVKLDVGKAFVEGVVVDDLDVPLKDAEVAADAEDNGRVGTTKTDAAGKFRLERVATKEPVEIHASAKGHEDGKAEKVALDSKDTRVVLHRLGKLTVRVLGADGKPVPLVFVKRIVAAGERGNSRPIEPMQQGAQGLEVPLRIGSVEIRVEAPGYDEVSVGDYQVEAGQVIDGGEVKLVKKSKTPKPKDGEKPKGGDDGGGDDGGDDGG